MEADSSSSFFKWVNTLPKISKTIIYWIIWISPFELYVYLIDNANSALGMLDLDKSSSLPNLAKYLIESPLNQLEKSSELASVLLDRTKELGVWLIPYLLLTFLGLISLLRWHFKGAPRNKNRLVNILLNPFLSLIPLEIISFHLTFGSSLVMQIQLLLKRDSQLNQFLGQNYSYENIYFNFAFSSIFIIVLSLILIISNKKARNLI